MPAQNFLDMEKLLFYWHLSKVKIILDVITIRLLVSNTYYGSLFEK